MPRPIFLLRLLLVCAGALVLPAASRVAAAAESAPAYAKTAGERAAKIVATLALTDAAVAARVQATIAAQYLALHTAHGERDAALAAAKSLSDPAAAATAAQQAQAASAARIQTLHTAYLAALASDLTPTQVDQVKDGMTYGVLPLTWRVYQEMLPDLTPAQREQILAWLTEARELAMDAGSSHEKHGVFGKYKGRINNYLSAAGINMKDAERVYLARGKAAPTPAAVAPSPAASSTPAAQP